MSTTISAKERALRQLQTIPGIGKSISLDLWNIGIREISDLKGQNPAVLYEKLNIYCRMKNDKCLLYTFRCAVYYATENLHEKEKLNWWFWKDQSYNE